ncbi:3-hydroxyacyl-CoA dehydrogenase family protein [Svornostia abyssi]|uniref:3-hydroxyacyl-CoA dehydrogenase family protein n=1 Tax=Svornostia abyssi TaxID=2898438 RepID=A0ABY5PFL5_9ACTN|nr:3-hydroxyacyl-CoA dehydrogenase family protein [Parviterribacteraceae bacterium J379]
MFVFTAAVVGAGTMGGEIAQVIASADIDVVLKDVDQAAIDAGLDRAREVTALQLNKLVSKGKLSQEDADARAAEILGRIDGTLSYDRFGAVDLVIEAVPERMEIKQAVMAELDDLVPGHTILASNTSALSITEMADVTARPDQVIGLHFFYPASRMRLVEIVEGEETSPETVQAAVAFVSQIRKSPIVCGEAPGFVVNRILMSAVSELWKAQHESGAAFAEFDQGLEATGAVPAGPFRLIDMLGLDTVLHVAEHLHDSYGDRVFVHPGMQELVAAGHLGQKTGKGFYEYGS